MLPKKKNSPQADRRKKDRRKPGDQRFSGRLIGIRKGVPRQADRRSGDRRVGKPDTGG